MNDNSKFNAKGETDQYIIKREKLRQERMLKEEAERKTRQEARREQQERVEERIANLRIETAKAIKVFE
jgi:hypothetical protein